MRLALALRAAAPPHETKVSFQSAFSQRAFLACICARAFPLLRAQAQLFVGAHIRTHRCTQVHARLLQAVQGTRQAGGSGAELSPNAPAAAASKRAILSAFVRASAVAPPLPAVSPCVYACTCVCVCVCALAYDIAY